MSDRYYQADLLRMSVERDGTFDFHSHHWLSRHDREASEELVNLGFWEQLPGKRLVFKVTDKGRREGKSFFSLDRWPQKVAGLCQVAGLDQVDIWRMVEEVLDAHHQQEFRYHILDAVRAKVQKVA